MRADDLLAELLHLLDLSGEVVGEGVLEGLFRGGLASEPSIETGSGVISGPTHLGLRGRVASRTVQSGGLDGLDLEGSADVGEGARTEGQRLGVVGLPALIFGAQVECPRVLQVCGQHDGLVTGLAGQLHAQIPRIQRHKGKLQVFAREVFLGEGIESGDGIAESPCRADMLPSQGGQARCITGQTLGSGAFSSGEGGRVKK